MKNENFIDPLEVNSKNLIEFKKEISIPDHKVKNNADCSKHLSQNVNELRNDREIVIEAVKSRDAL